MELGYISKAMDIDKENEISNHQYNKMRRKHRKELITHIRLTLPLMLVKR